MTKPIVVGFDFDGVVAYNPARVLRYPIALLKKRVLGIRRVSFFVPKNAMERAVWSIAHESSVFPAFGIADLRRHVANGRIEAHLVTSRFGYLEPNLRRFLHLWNLTGVFTTVTLNFHEEQPHRFKERILKERNFSYYVEDNWDIVSHLSTCKLKTEVHWIYNILDRKKPYPHKYPYLKKSLDAMMSK